MDTIKHKTLKIKEPIKVRTKKLSDGSASIYLDIYHKGIRKYEFLKLYLQPEINGKIKELNKGIMEIARTIKSQRTVELTKQIKEDSIPLETGDITLSEWFEKFRIIQKEKGIKNTEKLLSISKVISEYEKKRKVKLKKVDKTWVLNFSDWLQTGYRKNNKKLLSKSTVVFYLSQLSASLNVAKRMGKIYDNPFSRLDSCQKVKKPDSNREFLTVEELQLLKSAPCRNETVRRAFFFSCYTGLRISDIRLLTYNNIKLSNNHYFVSIIMKKTGKPINIPLSKNALEFISTDSINSSYLIFEGLPCLTTINSILSSWGKAASIQKHITYHTSRHSFGTLMITAGADLYVTSKLMGHSDVRTTQIYAKIIDSKKIEAVMKIDRLFSE